jgi:tetratricopeptide (TPR) repeat protein
VILLLGVQGRSDASIDSDLDQFGSHLNFLESNAKLIQREYLQFSDKASNSRRYEEYLADGQALMLLEDYVRAAVVFHRLVDDEPNQSRSNYIDAVYNLGEALFFKKNYIDARVHFRRVLDDRRGRIYRKLALVRLMQIALHTKDFAQVDQYYTSLQNEGGGISPHGEYLRAKTLFSRDRLDEAAASFAVLKQGQPFFFQSRYFLGVIQVRKGKIEQALAVFSDLVTHSPKRENEKLIIELAHLARGRLLHDLHKDSDAADAFQVIVHTSPNFDDALYETCWTYIQRAGKSADKHESKRWYLEAFRILEILEVSTPNSSFVPQAKLLKGHMMEKMGRFEEAGELFSSISSTYLSVRQELDDLLASHEDPVQYFNEVAGKNLDSFDLSSYLPPIAVRWMSRRDEMSTALGVMKDLEAGRRFVDESRALLGKLDALLSSEKDSINLFPLLLEGAKRSIELENIKVSFDRQLSVTEQKIIRRYVSSGERKSLAQARQSREDLEHQLDDLPTNQKESDSREYRARQRIEMLEQSVFQSGISIKGMKAQLQAMEEWIRQNPKKLDGREEAVRDFREEIRRGWAMTDQLQAELDVLSGKLGTEKARAGMDSEVVTQTDKLRKVYTQALAKERKLAENIHSRLGPKGSGQISRINRFRLRSEKLTRLLSGIRLKINDRVKVEAEHLGNRVQIEKKKLDQYEGSLAKLEKESNNLAGEVAYSALEDVRTRFHQLILEADVGVLDVAWSRKMETTRKISDLTQKQGVEQKRLYEEFKSVLEEVK